MLHLRERSTDPVTHWLGIWNWCDPNQRPSFQQSWQMNQSWRATYTRLTAAEGEPAEAMLYLHFESDQYGCWKAYLFNYDLGAYENISYGSFPVYCGTSYIRMTGTLRGWSMWELETEAFDCPTIPSIKAAELQAKTTDWGGGTKDFSHIYSGDIQSIRETGCFQFNNYDFHLHRRWPSDTYWWHAHTPLW